MTESLNIANRLTSSAARWPDQIAVVQPNGRDSTGQYRYRTWTFSQLEREAAAIANGLLAWGVQPGQRLVLMVRPSFEFIALTFGLMRAGIVVVLIDPGMGRSNIRSDPDRAGDSSPQASPVSERAIQRHGWRSQVVVGRQVLP